MVSSWNVMKISINEEVMKVLKARARTINLWEKLGLQFYTAETKKLSVKKSTADKACFINFVAEDNKKMMQAIDTAHYLCHIVALRLCLKGTIIFWRSEHLTHKTLCVFFPTICRW